MCVFLGMVQTEHQEMLSFLTNGDILAVPHSYKGLLWFKMIKGFLMLCRGHGLDQSKGRGSIK